MSNFVRPQTGVGDCRLASNLAFERKVKNATTPARPKQEFPMNARTTFNRLRTVASCALISSALVGTFLLFWPIATSFDLRSIGAAIGGGLAAIRVFHLV
jgi:hypothetical protein